MSTTTVYTTTDGRAYYGLAAPWSQANWDTVHDAATGTGADKIAAGGYASITFEHLLRVIYKEPLPHSTLQLSQTRMLSRRHQFFCMAMQARQSMILLKTF